MGPVNTPVGFLWARHFRGINESSSVVAYGLTVDDQAHVHVAGYFDDAADFNPGACDYTLTTPVGFSAYAAKLDPAGDFAWASNVQQTAGFSISKPLR